MESRSADRYELVYEGVVDDSTAVYRRVKGAFISELEYEISEVKEILKTAPVSLMKCRKEVGLKAPLKILERAGAKVSIRRSSEAGGKRQSGWHTTVLPLTGLWSDETIVNQDVVIEINLGGDSTEKTVSEDNNGSPAVVRSCGSRDGRRTFFSGQIDGRKGKKSFRDKPPKQQKPEETFEFDGMEHGGRRISPFIFEYGTPLIDRIRAKQEDEQRRRRVAQKLEAARRQLEERRKQRKFSHRLLMSLGGLTKEIAEEVQIVELGLMMALALVIFQIGICLQ